MFKLNRTLIGILIISLSSCATVPPATKVQTALDRGIRAAKKKDYPRAIRYFEEARKVSPVAPIIYFNLGLAEAKIPGRELRAIAWFNAYLTTVPDAPNAAAIKKQITELERVLQDNVLRLYKLVREFDRLTPGAQENQNGLKIIYLQANSQDSSLKSALDYTKLSSTSSVTEQFQKDYACLSILEAEVAADDIAGAQKTVDSITDPGTKSSGLRTIAIAQAWGGDVAGAQKTAALILPSKDTDGDPIDEAVVLKDIALIQAGNGDTSDYRSAARPAIPVSEWLKMLDGESKFGIYRLKTAPFLDLAGYLKSQSVSQDPQILFELLFQTTGNILGERNFILRLQSKVGQK